MNPILSITGSDSTGAVGIQADIRTAAEFGAYAVTVITAIAVQDQQSIQHIEFLSPELILQQTRSIVENSHPRAVKVGMIGNPSLFKPLRDEIIGCKNLVLDPGFLSYEKLGVDSSLCRQEFCRHLLPDATLLMLKCAEAELLLNRKISTDDDMLEAAREFCKMGAQWVFLRAATYNDGQLTALLLGPDHQQFFSSYNTEGWQQHGIGGALSTAIATRLSYGDSIPTALQKAHDYLHHQVVYSVSAETQQYRTAELYNRFLSLITDNYRMAHDVAFYAERLCISTRYLSSITDKAAGKSPKQIIADYLLHNAKVLLDTTNMNIQEIADQLGFPNQQNFCRFFHSQSGYSPSSHRNLQ